MAFYSRIQVLESGSGISNGELPVDSLLPLVPVLLYEKQISVYEQKRSLLFGRDRNLILNAGNYFTSVMRRTQQPKAATSLLSTYCNITNYPPRENWRGLIDTLFFLLFSVNLRKYSISADFAKDGLYFYCHHGKDNQPHVQDIYTVNFRRNAL